MTSPFWTGETPLINAIPSNIPAFILEQVGDLKECPAVAVMMRLLLSEPVLTLASPLRFPSRAHQLQPL
jgi:hypothetical protein